MTTSIRELAEDDYDEARILNAFPALVPVETTAALEHERTMISGTSWPAGVGWRGRACSSTSYTSSARTARERCLASRTRSGSGA